MSWSVLVGSLTGAVGGVGATIVPNASHALGDIELLVVEGGATDTITLTTAAGFARVSGFPQTSGGAAMTGRGIIDLFWRRWNGADGSPVIQADSNHCMGVIVSARGAIRSGSPFDVAVVVDASQATQNTSVICPSATTLRDGCLIIDLVSQGLPDAISSAEFSSWANGNLAGVAELFDGASNVGNGGSIGIATGTKAAAGSTGTTTASAATSSFRATAKVALRPALDNVAVQSTMAAA